MGATGTARSGSGESRVSWDFRHWRDPPTRGRGRRKRSGTCAGPRATLPPQSVGASRRQRTAAVGHRPRKCPRSEGRNLSRPVSRILCDRLRGPAVIPLGRRLPGGSSDLNPEAWDEPPASLFGLAPGGVYLASAVTGGSGELLPHRFTLTAAPSCDGSMAVCFLWHCPRLATGRHYRPPCSMESGLSSRASWMRRRRLPGRLRLHRDS